MSFHMAQEFLTEEEELEQDKDVIEALSKANKEATDTPVAGWSAVEPVARTIENLANRFHVKVKDIKVTLESGRLKKLKDTVFNESYLELYVPELFSVLGGDGKDKQLQSNESQVFHKLLKIETMDIYIKSLGTAPKSWLMSIEETSFTIDIRDQISPEDAVIHRKTETALDIQRIHAGICEWNLEFSKTFFRGMKIPSVTGKYYFSRLLWNEIINGDNRSSSLTCSFTSI